MSFEDKKLILAQQSDKKGCFAMVSGTQIINKGVVMKRLGCHSILFFLFFMIVASCASVPVTGRQQLSLVPNSTIIPMSFKEYDAFLKQHRLSDNKKQTEMVKQVGSRIEKAVEQYFLERGLTHLLEGYSWEFNLVDGKDVNAWCMPGGKVVVYSGILPVAQDADGLAVVMGHEIAHAVANHGGERMSQGLLTQMGGIALATALHQQPEQTRQIWLTAFGLGAQLGVMLPYSRLYENEADKLGLIFMAMAGYDPRKAVGFWERMAQQKEGRSPPEFLSTHPSDNTRIDKIQASISEAMDYYKKVK